MPIRMKHVPMMHVKNGEGPTEEQGHRYIKTLFSVLGGGLPQFNTSDHFHGRESLSYMPPDI